MISKKLRNYIDSGGNHLPDNFASYRHTKTCLFCDEYTNNDFSVFFFPEKLTTKKCVTTGTIACEVCALSVKRMEDSKDGVVPRGSMFSTGTDLYERQKLYVTMGKFDETVGMHLVNRDQAIAPLQHKCYFCKSTHVIVPTRILHVPVEYDLDNGFTGGAVQCCNGCYSDLLDLEDAVIPLEEIPEHFYVRWVCAQCSSDYYVSKRENEARHYAHKSDYLCPECTYTQCIDYDFLPLGISKNAVIERVMVKVCDFCRVEFFLDMARPGSTLEHEHVNGAGRLMCTHCASYGPDGPIDSIRLADDVIMMIYKVPGRHKRYLFRVRYVSSGKIIWEKALTGKLIDLVVDVVDDQRRLYNSQNTLSL